jgi:hypothetical protein
MPLKLTITAAKIQKLAHDNGCLSLMEEHKAEEFLKDNFRELISAVNDELEERILEIMAQDYTDA